MSTVHQLTWPSQAEQASSQRTTFRTFYSVLHHHPSHQSSTPAYLGMDPSMSTVHQLTWHPHARVINVLRKRNFSFFFFFNHVLHYHPSQQSSTPVYLRMDPSMSTVHQLTWHSHAKVTNVLKERHFSYFFTTFCITTLPTTVASLPTSVWTRL